MEGKGKGGAHTRIFLLLLLDFPRLLSFAWPCSLSTTAAGPSRHDARSARREPVIASGRPAGADRMAAPIASKVEWTGGDDGEHATDFSQKGGSARSPVSVIHVNQETIPIPTFTSLPLCPFTFTSSLLFLLYRIYSTAGPVGHRDGFFRRAALARGAGARVSADS